MTIAQYVDVNRRIDRLESVLVDLDRVVAKLREEVQSLSHKRETLTLRGRKEDSSRRAIL